MQRRKINMKNAVEVAKRKWIEMLVKIFSDMKIHPKIAWDNIKTLREDFSGHHVDKSTIKIRNKEGVIATNDEDNAKNAGEFFSKVFNRDAVVDWTRINETPQRVIRKYLGNAMSFAEFNTGLVKLCRHKSPEINGAYLNMLKALNYDNELVLFRFIKDLMMNDDVNYDDWKMSRLVSLHKRETFTTLII